MRTAISDSNVNNKAEGKAVCSQIRDDLKQPQIINISEQQCNRQLLGN